VATFADAGRLIAETPESDRDQVVTSLTGDAEACHDCITASTGDESRPRWGASVMAVSYTAVVDVDGESRNGGHVRSSDGLLETGLALPKELGGAGAVA
jgi:hypothetical protein